jgi:hypothetical protein
MGFIICEKLSQVREFGANLTRRRKIVTSCQPRKPPATNSMVEDLAGKFFSYEGLVNEGIAVIVGLSHAAPDRSLCR